MLYIKLKFKTFYKLDNLKRRYKISHDFLTLFRRLRSSKIISRSDKFVKGFNFMGFTL